MKLNKIMQIVLVTLLLISKSVEAQNSNNIIANDNNMIGIVLLFLVIIVPVFVFIVSLYFKFKTQLKENKEWQNQTSIGHFSGYLKNLDTKQIINL